MLVLFVVITMLLPPTLTKEIMFDVCPDVEVVQKFNLSAYLGRWYEQQKYPNQHERDGKCITADYSINSDGSIHVLNAMKNHKTNEFESIEGTAKLDSKTGEGKLLIYFKDSGMEKEAPYWILGTDYTNYSVVWNCWNPRGEDVSKAAWILTRSDNPSEEVIKTALNILEKQKIDIQNFVQTIQKDC